eukprot:TRINITY_DN1514_c0_g1_i2.p1 TRINITY_DN1514_c0_g1~~TRINITY_DN1514_c0_g1_i2.p1  ORF type:complete len:148 (-),score=38.76 TRINITY_DN1514_c0_g1_i2:61-504(-)
MWNWYHQNATLQPIYHLGKGLFVGLVAVQFGRWFDEQQKTWTYHNLKPKLQEEKDVIPIFNVETPYPGDPVDLDGLAQKFRDAQANPPQPKEAATKGQRFLRERQKVVQQIQSGFGGELTLTGDVDKAEERVRAIEDKVLSESLPDE